MIKKLIPALMIMASAAVSLPVLADDAMTAAPAMQQQNSAMQQDHAQMKQDHEQMKQDRMKMKADRAKMREDRMKHRQMRHEHRAQMMKEHGDKASMQPTPSNNDMMAPAAKN
jgi:ketopantoate reductase